MDKYLGVDIGGTAVKIGIVTAEGRVTARKTYPVNFDGYKTPIIDTVVKSIGEFLGECKEKPIGIGVSATGQIDVEKGIVAGGCGNIPSWRGCKLKEILEERFSLSVTVINDANAVALAEKAWGGAKGAENVIVVTIGTGVGGGIISGGRLLMGNRGIGGELGHFVIDYHGDKCTCGNNGCLEKYASTTALVRMIKENEKLSSKFTGEEINGRTIFSKISDFEIAAAIDQWIDYLATGLVGLTHIFNPEVILIGGGVSKEKADFIAPLREKVLKRVMPEFAKGLKIEAAALGNSAGMVGGAEYFRTSRK